MFLGVDRSLQILTGMFTKYAGVHRSLKVITDVCMRTFISLYMFTEACRYRWVRGAFH